MCTAAGLPRFRFCCYVLHLLYDRGTDSVVFRVLLRENKYIFVPHLCTLFYQSKKDHFYILIIWIKSIDNRYLINRPSRFGAFISHGSLEPTSPLLSSHSSINSKTTVENSRLECNNLDKKQRIINMQVRIFSRACRIGPLGDG